MNSPSILSLGEVLWDLFPDGPRFGGAPANFACHAVRQGGRVSLLSAVGNDDRGRAATAILQRLGVDTSLLQTRGGTPTGIVDVQVDRSGKPTFTIQTGAAWDHIAWTPELVTQLAATDAVYFGTLGQRGAESRATIQRVLRAAQARGLPRVLDVNLRRPFYDAASIRESIAQSSILKFSDDELPEVAAASGVALASDPAETLRVLRQRHSLDLVAMTRGAAGALLVTATETIDQPGIPTVVVDTVGAGDSFTAALIVGWLRRDPLPTIAHTACVTAAAVCAHAGAVPVES